MSGNVWRVRRLNRATRSTMATAMLSLQPPQLAPSRPSWWAQWDHSLRHAAPSTAPGCAASARGAWCPSHLTAVFPSLLPDLLFVPRWHPLCHAAPLYPYRSARQQVWPAPDQSPQTPHRGHPDQAVDTKSPPHRIGCSQLHTTDKGDSGPAANPRDQNPKGPDGRGRQLSPRHPSTVHQPSVLHHCSCLASRLFLTSDSKVKPFHSLLVF